MVSIDDVERVAAGFWSLGGEAVELGIARGCRRAGVAPTTPECFLHDVHPGSPDELAALVETTARWCRRIVIGERTPPWVTARLVARDWTLEHQLHLVLPAGVDATGTAGTGDRPVPLRPVVAGDWPRLGAMLRVDHLEEDARAGVPARPQARTDDALTVRRALAAHADYLVADRGGGDGDSGDGDSGGGDGSDGDRVVGFVAGWADERGVGIVEDVFVDPGHRRRGIASSLVAAAVAGARERGAGPVVIAADPLDHPKHLYRSLGFVPVAVSRTLVAPVTEEPSRPAP